MDVAVGATVSYSVMELHTVVVVHWRLEVAVEATVWYCEEVQIVVVAHWVLAEEVDAAVWYCKELHGTTELHTRSLVAVGATL